MGAEPPLTCLHTALLPANHDLSERVERLLDVQPLRAIPSSRTRSLASSSSVVMAVCIAILLVLPATLSSVHRLLELFLH
jgi:hypothetical protein